MTNCLAKLFHYGFKVGGISFMTAIIKRIINFFFVSTHSSGITFNEDDLHATRDAPSSSVEIVVITQVDIRGALWLK